MILARKEGADATTTDKFGRTAFKFPKTGPSYIFNRVEWCRKENIPSHVNDLKTILNKEGKQERILILCLDGGSD